MVQARTGNCYSAIGNAQTRESAQPKQNFAATKLRKLSESDQTNSFSPLAPGGLPPADRFDVEDLAKFGYSSERKEEHARTYGLNMAISTLFFFPREFRPFFPKKNPLYKLWPAPLFSWLSG